MPTAKTSAGNVAHQQEKPGCLKNQSGGTIMNSQPRTCYPFFSIVLFHRQADLLSFQGPLRGRSIVPGIAEQRHRNKDIATWPFNRCHTHVTPPSHASPQCMHWCTCRRNSTCGCKPLNKILARPHICLEAFRCSAQTVCEMRGSVASGARSGSTRLPGPFYMDIQHSF